MALKDCSDVIASMAEADCIGVSRDPEIEQPVAALMSPDEAL